MGDKLDELQIAEQTSTLITAIVQQTHKLSNEGVLPTLMDEEMYDGVEGTAKEKINDTSTAAGNAKGKYDSLKNIPQGHWYKFDILKQKHKKEELQREVVGDLITAVENNADATKLLFNQIVQLSTCSRQLYIIGLMGIAANRIVVREIQKRLENASQNEIDELAYQELKSVMKELSRQRALDDKIEKLQTKQDYIPDLEKIRSNAQKGAEALQPTDIADWAKAKDKPYYTADEVGALPDSTFIPSKMSDLDNDKGFLTEHQDIRGKADISFVKEQLQRTQDNLSQEVTTLQQTLQKAQEDLQKEHQGYEKLKRALVATSICTGTISIGALIALLILIL